MLFDHKKVPAASPSMYQTCIRTNTHVPPQKDTVDGSEIPNNNLGYINLIVNNGIGYQPQLVNDGFLNHQQ